MAGRFSIEAVFKAVDRVTAPVSRMQKRVGKFTRKMERGLRSVNRRLNKMIGGLKRGAAIALKFGGAAIIAGVTATAIAINKVADAADALAKRTRRIKFPIKEFQEWQFVAEQSGISSEMFDKSMEKFVKTVGEARAGTGTLVTILKKTNKPLLRQLLATNDVSKAFDIYMSALRGTENQMEKTALATAAFGRTGGKFLNITEQSAEAIKALRLEQRENGVITAQQAKSAEDYNDAVNSLQRSLFGLLQTVIIPMLPKITETLRIWRDWIVANKEIVRTNISKFLDKIKESVLKIVESLKKMNKENSVLERLKVLIVGLSDLFIFLAENGALIFKIVASIVILSLALKTLAVVMAVVNLVMALNPISLLLIAYALLAAGIVAIIANWDSLKAAFLDLDAVKAASEIIGNMADIVVKRWGVVKTFFTDMWDGIVGIFDSGIDRIMSVIDKIKAIISSIPSIDDITGGISDFFGFGDDGDEEIVAAATPTPQVAGPPDRVARLMEESRTTSTAEVTIRDESGRAEVTAGTMGAGVTLQPTGGF